jgi:hypothetical protein
LGLTEPPRARPRSAGAAPVTRCRGGTAACGGSGPRSPASASGGERALQPWGEEIIKRFVRETLDEALKLETALARLRTVRRVAILHYAPIQATVEGEPPDLYPFLGRVGSRSR